MGLLGIFDFMAVNSRMAWNMPFDDDLCTHKRFKLNNWKFRLMLAEEMIQFKDEHAVDHIAQAALNISADVNNHSPTMIRSDLRVKCCVCSLEHMIQSLVKKSEGGPKQLEEMMGMELKHIKSAAYVKKWIVSCLHERCTLYAQNVLIESDSIIFKCPEFIGLTCFQIAHHPLTRGLWTCNELHKLYLNENQTERNQKQRAPRVYNVRTSHALYNYLR